MLVAPWWHWPTEPTGHGRTSYPAFQKYETSDLANAFLADPQRRLAFLPQVDEVVQIEPGAHPWDLPTRAPTGMRKLFLATHHRHYLVTCELHCDATGFPQVTRDQVCQAGFVVRRRSVRRWPPRSSRRGGSCCAALPAPAAAWRRASASSPWPRSPRAAGAPLAQLRARHGAAAAVVAQQATAVRAWASSTSAARALEGWVPQGMAGGTYVDLPPCAGAPGSAGSGAGSGGSGSGSAAPVPLAGVGRWTGVDEEPEELTEAWFPLSPLVADPTDPTSDAAGATIFFGVVPTGSSDLDPSGTARFDDEHVYEIRCFVRRHKPACPRTGPQCHCPLVWSEPTEAYQLATHFDLQGTANRPVTIQLPDLNALKGDALGLPLGSAAGVVMKSPQRLMPKAGFPPGGSIGGAEICSFSIPLITIVATFVFSLFLPIVVLVFQLWFLLALKFCIPPEVNFDAQLAAALATATPGDVGFEAQFGAEIDSGIDALMSDADLGSGSASQILKSSDPAAPPPARQAGLRQPGGCPAPGRPRLCPRSRALERDAVTAGADRLGTGVAFPFLPDPVTGGLDWSSGAENVRECVRLILQTDPGERVMRPSYGAGLDADLMDPNNPATRSAIARQVQAALAANETRITVTAVDVVPGDDPSEVLVTVSYVHVRDSSPGSLGVSVQTAGLLAGAT